MLNIMLLLTAARLSQWRHCMVVVWMVGNEDVVTHVRQRTMCWCWNSPPLPRWKIWAPSDRNIVSRYTRSGWLSDLRVCNCFEVIASYGDIVCAIGGDAWKSPCVHVEKRVGPTQVERCSCFDWHSRSYLIFGIKVHYSVKFFTKNNWKYTKIPHREGFIFFDDGNENLFFFLLSIERSDNAPNRKLKLFLIEVTCYNIWTLSSSLAPFFNQFVWPWYTIYNRWVEKTISKALIGSCPWPVQYCTLTQIKNFCSQIEKH